MLYALRYQKQAASNIASLVSALKEQGVSGDDAQVYHILFMMCISLTWLFPARLRSPQYVGG